MKTPFPNTPLINNPGIAALGLNWQPAEPANTDSGSGSKVYTALPNDALWEYWLKNKAECKAAGLSLTKDVSGKWTVYLNTATPFLPDPKAAHLESVLLEQPVTHRKEAAITSDVITTGSSSVDEKDSLKEQTESVVIDCHSSVISGQQRLRVCICTRTHRVKVVLTDIASSEPQLGTSARSQGGVK